MSKTGYIIYVDEAGDFGTRTVSPIDPRGASEWMILGAIVIRKEDESKAPAWLKSMRDAAKIFQPPSLHFRTLQDRQKTIVCAELAKLRARAFVVISNKRNMRRYSNPRAGYISAHKHWFYMWMSRLLLERVTDFCASINVRDHTPDKKIQLEFSRRKDIQRNHFTDYFTRIWIQGKDTHLTKRTINWEVFDFENVNFYDHDSRAGLQFADIVASAFYQAINTNPQGSCCADYATALKPIVCKKGIKFLDEGFSVQPHSLRQAMLTDAQKEVFRAYGFPDNRM